LALDLDYFEFIITILIKLVKKLRGIRIDQGPLKWIYSLGVSGGFLEAQLVYLVCLKAKSER
jgi:hypothetical protein